MQILILNGNRIFFKVWFKIFSEGESTLDNKVELNVRGGLSNPRSKQLKEEIHLAISYLFKINSAL